METLTGIMIAILIFYSGKLVLKDEIDINNFFSFLAAMMLAYQPVRSLATMNITISQGLSSAARILPVIDEKSELIESNVGDGNGYQNRPCLTKIMTASTDKIDV